jgi:diguanylate cyclase (GGDEF)-like protein
VVRLKWGKKRAWTIWRRWTGVAQLRETGSGRGRPRVGIIGLSQCPGLMRELEGGPLEIVAVADFASYHESLNEAKGKGVFVTQDYTELLERRDLDLLVNLIPDKTVEAIIHQLKPENVHVLHSGMASLLRAFSDQWRKRGLLCEVLREVSGVISTSRATSFFVQATLERMEEALGLEGASLWIKKKEGMALYKASGRGEVWYKWGHLLEESGLLSALLEEKNPLVVKELGAKFPSISSEMGTEVGALSMVVLPAFKELEVVGALGVLHAKESFLDKEAQEIASLLGNLMVDIVLRGEEMASLGDSAIRDELTGLYNAAYFLDRLKSEMRRASRKDSQVSLLYLTTGGERARDPIDGASLRESLAPLAEGIRSCIRNMDVPARYRLHDLVILLPDTPPSGALTTATRLLEHISKAKREAGGRRSPEVFVGVASFPRHAQSAMELLQNAEFAALLAKREGRSQVRVFPVSHMDLDGLSPEAVLREYPSLKEAFDLLEAKSQEDPLVFVHAKEVGKYSALMARELGLEARKCFEVGVAGWIHDLGKVALPAPDGKIKLRSPKLRDLNLRLHPTIGAVMLRNLGAPPGILRGVFYHHAHYDGSGHPPKVRGEGIPIEARILAVADIFHHLLLENRESEGEFTHLVFQRLRDKAGKELDPSLVECLIRAVSSG